MNDNTPPIAPIATVTLRARDSSGLTLADMERFVEQAKNAGADKTTTVKAVVGFKGQIRSITA
ncbi:hypothetical protein [Arthrobacter sp. NPDC090010]|uniref:hypothetical protein n=1 Tax=Arthrobacter sp. NPDC090010 TaxID=3363942 RepID=UPI003822DD19